MTIEQIEKFQNEMITILNDKFNKYKDTWKTVKFHKLYENLDFQIDKLFKNISLTNQELKRTLIHIANYCYFIYIRLEGVE